MCELKFTNFESMIKNLNNFHIKKFISYQLKYHLLKFNNRFFNVLMHIDGSSDTLTQTIINNENIYSVKNNNCNILNYLYTRRQEENRGKSVNVTKMTKNPH